MSMHTITLAPSANPHTLLCVNQEEEEEVRYVADLEKDGDKVLLASGGKPGLGNLHVASRRVGTVSEWRPSRVFIYRRELAFFILSVRAVCVLFSRAEMRLKDSARWWCETMDIARTFVAYRCVDL